MEFGRSWRREDKPARRRLREDKEGSWRSILVLAQETSSSSVKLKLHEPEEEEKRFRGAWNLDKKTTLGMVFDRIDSATHSRGDKELVAMFGKMSATCCEEGVDCPYH